jgi:hypothetical protein
VRLAIPSTAISQPRLAASAHRADLRHQARGQLDIYCQAPQNAKVSQVCLASCIVLVCANRIVFPAESRSYVVLLCSQGSLSVVLRSTPACGYSEGCVSPALRLISLRGALCTRQSKIRYQPALSLAALDGFKNSYLQFMSCSYQLAIAGNGSPVEVH